MAALTENSVIKKKKKRQDILNNQERNGGCLFPILSLTLKLESGCQELLTGKIENEKQLVPMA